MAQQQKLGKKRWLNWKVKMAIGGILPAHLLYSFYCLYFFPPTTLTQISAVLTDRVTFQRDYVPKRKISRNLYLALMAREDANFLRHQGFEWQNMHSALREGKGAGSTISQQTAKNTFAYQQQDLFRKALEIYSTALIEKTWGKERIMEVYANIIEFEQGIYGAEAVAQKFFNKPASQLSAIEAAMIASCTPDPKGCLSRRINSSDMRKVRAKVLKEMSYLNQRQDIRDFLERMSK